MNKNTMDWEFRLVDLTDYEIKATMAADAKLFHTIYNHQFKNKLKAKAGLSNSDILQHAPERFKVPASHLNYVGVACRKIINIIRPEVLEDGIRLTTHRFASAEFIRDPEGKSWNINVVVRGNYVR